MTRPRLLDLFCGAGGCSMGYHRAGFDVTGVDIRQMSRYPFEFHKADALEFPLDGFDAIHASPPCQDHSVTQNFTTRRHGSGWMLAATRERLEASGLPWVIENVPGAPMRPDFKLCGCMFGLKRLKRERWFETSWHGFDLRSPCLHLEPVITVAGHDVPSHQRKFGRRHHPGRAQGSDGHRLDGPRRARAGHPAGLRRVRRPRPAGPPGIGGSRMIFDPRCSHRRARARQRSRGRREVPSVMRLRRIPDGCPLKAPGRAGREHSDGERVVIVKLYLAGGPMRGYEAFNHPAFHRATKLLRDLGHDVFSPAEHDNSVGLDTVGMTGDHSEVAAAMLCVNCALILLPPILRGSAVRPTPW